MPLILMVGPPCSGKSYWAGEVSKLITTKNREVSVVSENDIRKNVNETYSDSRMEKELRAQLKSFVQRHLNKEKTIIVDAMNYIKGFRYELFCLAKEQATTYCIVECSIPKEKAWNKNEDKSEGQRYSSEVFNALYFRYEAPDSRNRWDSPYFLMTCETQSSLDDIYSALFENKPLKPNKSTKPHLMTEASFLFQLDAQTKEIIDHISKALKMGATLSQIKVPGVSCGIESNQSLTPAELNRIRRSFITYTKMHPLKDTGEIKSTFVQYLNSRLSQPCEETS